MLTTLRRRFVDRLPWATHRSVDQRIERAIDELNSALSAERLTHLVAAASTHESLAEQITTSRIDLTDLLRSHLGDNAAAHTQLNESVESIRRDTSSHGRTLGEHATAMSELRTDLDVVRALSDRPAARLELTARAAWYGHWAALAPLTSHALVSIVLPTRGRREYLDRAVTSVGVQTYATWELIIVDDADADESSSLSAMEEADDRIRVVRSGGVGVAAARQVGVDAALGSIVAYLDDDNLMDPGWLRSVVEILGRRPEVDAVYGAQIRVDLGPEPALLFEPFDELGLVEGNYIDMGALAHRREMPVCHPAGLDAFNDWQFVLDLSLEHRLEPVPSMSGVYLTDATGRISERADRYQFERSVRSQAAQRRLADPEFVTRSLETLRMRPGSDVSQLAWMTSADADTLLAVMSALARGLRRPLQVLEWGSGRSSMNLPQALRTMGHRCNWLTLEHDGTFLHDLLSSEVNSGRAVVLDSKGDTADLGNTLARNELVGVSFDFGVIDVSENSPTRDADRRLDLSDYVEFPRHTGLEFDVVLVDGRMRRRCLLEAAEAVESNGVVLLHDADREWYHCAFDAYRSWRLIGDDLWIGSTFETDFTGIVPIRALLRGLTRPAPSAGATGRTES